VNSSAVKVAIVGHTNTGKTSLLRTLTRDDTFGVVSDQPGTTRDVRGAALLDVQGNVAVELYDTPGLEDSEGLIALVRDQFAGRVDPVGEIDAFIASDHGAGRYEQEAKVLRQFRQSDAAVYVIDAREPLLGKHRDELRLLAMCGRPLMPLLNFVALSDANAQLWKDQLARLSLHVVAEFDSVVFDQQAEQRVFEKLGTLLESKRDNFRRIIDAHKKLRGDQIASACRAVALMLVNIAGMRIRVKAGEPLEPAIAQLQDKARRAEQQCVDGLLEIFDFELSAYDPPQLPLEHRRWTMDLFDPETAKTVGVRLATGIPRPHSRRSVIGNSCSAGG
jgi:small GTP-binding protein